MGIFRTNNPLEYDQVDGIVIDERAPAPGIKGVGTGVAILVGQFARGVAGKLVEPGSSDEIGKIFGRDLSYPGYKALVNKKFSRLKIARVVAADAVKASLVLNDAETTPAPALTISAKEKGLYGNAINVLVEVEGSGRKYTITDLTEGRTTTPEVYSGLITEIAALMAESELVDVTVAASANEPAVLAVTPLATGADGTIVDTDYETVLDGEVSQELAGNVVFLDEYTAIRNTYLKTHAAETQERMCILAGAEDETVTQVETAVVTQRDTDGRLIYAFNWLETLVDGVKTFVSPASFYASIISQTGPNIDPASADNVQFLYGVTDVKQKLKRADYIRLMNAGVSAFEFDPDIGFKIKSGVVTQIANSSKVMVFRRRMADFLTNSMGRFLKLYQNKENSKGNRDAVNGAIRNFDRTYSEGPQKIMPNDAEVNTGKALLVDTESLNTDQSIGEGKFFIKYKRRIYSSMRFIVLIAEIGETVVVTEGEE